MERRTPDASRRDWYFTMLQGTFYAVPLEENFLK
jgi:hypothetical protein